MFSCRGRVIPAGEEPIAPMVRTKRNIDSPPFTEALAGTPGPLLCLLGRPALLAGKHFAQLKLRPKAVALVAYLALVGTEISRRELARLLFPEAEEPLGVLRWHLVHIRTAAPPFVARRLRATRDEVALSIPTDVALSFGQACRSLADGPRPQGPPGRWRCTGAIW